MESRRRPRVPARAYRQAVRAERAAANGQSIVDAAVGLIRNSRRVADVTLDDVARASGLTVRTVLRRFGSREGVFHEAFRRLGEEIGEQRVPTRPGDVEAALRSLFAQYEKAGEINVRALEEEDQIPLLHELLEAGRAAHRAWLREVFAPQLASLRGAARERVVTALYAATDVYLWKLLRRDLALDAKATLDVFRRLVRGVLSSSGRSAAGKGE